jgi:hypothetical protein
LQISPIHRPLIGQLTALWKARFWQALAVAGRFAVAVPFAETLMAGWLLARAEVKSSEWSYDSRPNPALRSHLFGKDAVERPRFLVFSLPRRLPELLQKRGSPAISFKRRG